MRRASATADEARIWYNEDDGLIIQSGDTIFAALLQAGKTYPGGLRSEAPVLVAYDSVDAIGTFLDTERLLKKKRDRKRNRNNQYFITIPRRGIYRIPIMGQGVPFNVYSGQKLSP